MSSKYGTGLSLINAIRAQVKNLPMAWYGEGYRLALSIAEGVAATRSPAPGSRPFLKDIPIVKGLTIGDRINNRILYRFRIRLFEKYGRIPKTFIVDVTSNSPLTADQLAARLDKKVLATYTTSPNARRGGVVKDIREWQSELIFVGRRY